MHPKRPKVASTLPKTAQQIPRRLQDDPRSLQEDIQKTRRGHAHLYSQIVEGYVGLLLFGFPTALDGPKGYQDRPKTAQEASNMASGQPRRRR